MTDFSPGPGPFILTVNGGSSSLKFALYPAGGTLTRRLSGLIDRIGMPGSVMSVTRRTDGPGGEWAVQAPDSAACAGLLLHWLDRNVGFPEIRGVGHRVVHGGSAYSRPEPVTEGLLSELRRISPFDPEHLPSEIALIESFRERCPGLLQVACFDTAFHQGMPRVARLVAIPRRYDRKGVRRYGFHGLSYAYLMKELARVGRPGEPGGRIVLAHLGNGASMAAVRNGKPVDTTMGFTPTSGLPMSRRSGDLDPGLVSFLARTEGMTPEAFHRMVNTESGLLGVSETSSDLRDLLAREPSDPRAAEAIELFCYQARKWIGALAAALGGLDTLVFSGGIGENSPVVRERICRGLEFLGLALDEERNRSSDPLISRPGSAGRIRVIRTDEESEIAHAVLGLLSSGAVCP